MKAEHKAILEQKLEEFLDDETIVESPDRGYVYDRIVEDMANAVEVVWDSLINYQDWEKRENM